MATGISDKTEQKPRLWLWLLGALAVVAIAALLVTWPSIRAYSQTGAAYSARVVCSCRYIGGRSLGDCRKDMEPGTEIVRIAEAEDAKRIDASVPFIAAESAEYREGYGCVLTRRSRQGTAD